MRLNYDFFIKKIKKKKHIQLRNYIYTVCPQKFRDERFVKPEKTFFFFFLNFDFDLWIL